MPIIKRARGAQYPLVAEYVFNFNDGAATTLGNTLTGASQELNLKTPILDFGSGIAPSPAPSGVIWSTGVAQTGVYELFALPINAQVIGGDVDIEAPYIGPATATLSLGNAGSATLYTNGSTVNLKGTAFTNQPTTITNTVNAAGNYTTQVMGNATANGVTAVGQVVEVTGCTGASASFNGSFIVDAFTATSVTVTNVTLTQSLTLAGTPNAVFMTGRTALTIPGQATNQLVGFNQIAFGSDAAVGQNVLMTLALGAGAATQGRVRVRIWYTLDGRQNEVQTT